LEARAMLVEISICTILIAFLLWMINYTLSGIHGTLKEIQHDISMSRGSLANVEILADKVYGDVD
jgi:hypothetical protein